MTTPLCPACGRPAHDAEGYCTHCGTPIPVASGGGPPDVPRPGGGDDQQAAPGDSDPFAEERVTVVCKSELGERSLNLRSGDRVMLGQDGGPIAGICTNNISGRHAEIYRNDHGMFLEDVGSTGKGSTNGTFVNGARLTPREPVQVHPGMFINLAADPPLRLEIEAGGVD